MFIVTKKKHVYREVKQVAYGVTKYGLSWSLILVFLSFIMLFYKCFVGRCQFVLILLEVSSFFCKMYPLLLKKKKKRGTMSVQILNMPQISYSSFSF